MDDQLTLKDLDIRPHQSTQMEVSPTQADTDPLPLHPFETAEKNIVPVLFHTGENQSRTHRYPPTLEREMRGGGGERREGEKGGLEEERRC